MKNIKKIASAAFVAGIITTSSLTVYADAGTTEKFTFPRTKVVSNESGSFAFGGGRAHFNGARELTDEQKAEMQAKMTERLSELLAAGEITQEEYDKALEGFADGKMTFAKRFGGGQMAEMSDEQKAEMQAKMTERLTELLAAGEITQEEYDKALEGFADGKVKIVFDRKFDTQA